MRFDVAVVGAGPAGLIAARETSRRGVKTAVFEEDQVVGRPEKCAGLYSIEGLKGLGIPVEGPYLQNKVRGAVFVSPSGRIFEVDAGHDVAVVCNRERFDQFLAEQALSAGAELFLEERVVEAKVVNGEARTKTKNVEVASRYLIVAEGRTAATARQVFPNYQLNGWLPIVQYQISNHQQDPEMVYLYFRRYIPEFFGYLVPVDERVGKLGVAASKNTDKLAAKLLSELFPHAKLLGVSSSSIYLGKPLQHPLKGPAMLVGDVAGQTKATTGGGVIMGGFAAIAAAKHAAGEGRYQDYLKPVLRELNRTYLLRSLTAKLSPKMLDILFQAVKESGLENILGKVGDMDKHMPTVAKALLTPSAFKLWAYLFSAFLPVAGLKLK
ncbi:MAG: NAD(P)/FAD-dependent oxidoreductase [Candidatus Caldarchaeum sp.]